MQNFINEKQLDRSYLSSFYGEMVNDIGEVFGMFISEVPVELSWARHCLNEGNVTEAGERLHQIAPSFANVGLPQFTDTLRQAMCNIKDGDILKAKAMLHIIQEELNSYFPALVKEYNRLEALHKGN